MFELLPATLAGRETAPSHAALSLGVHAALISAAVLLTTQTGLAPAHRAPAEPVHFIPIRIHAATSAGPVGSRVGVAPGPGPIAARLPFPLEIPTIVASVPSVSAFLAEQGARPTVSGVGDPTWLGSPAPGGAWTANDVDEPARVLQAGRLRYPVVLERAGIGGRVVLEFVVDTTGRVEPGSVRVVEESQAGFRTPALEAALSSRFRAGRAGGAAVRQLVRQEHRFVANGR